MGCKLKLEKLLFDEIVFKRIGDRNENKLKLGITVSIGTNSEDENMKKVSVKFSGIKKEEYSFDIQATGYFNFEGSADDSLIQQNAVAIVMPYLRSEISLLTAQPGMECVLLPPLNIVEIMKSKDEKKRNNS